MAKFELGRTAKQTVQEIWADVRNDERNYAESVLTVVNKDDEVVSFDFTVPQIRMDELYMEFQRAQIRLLLLLLKYRQLGSTTWWCHKIHVRVMTRPNHKAHITAHRKERAEEVLKLQSSFLDCLPKALKPVIDTKNAGKLVLSDRNSQVTCSSAADPEAMRGLGAPRSILNTEAAYYGDKGGSLSRILTSGLQAVPDRPDAMVVNETTGNGQDDEFYDYFSHSVAGENIWDNAFFEWFLDPQYEKDLHSHAQDRARGITWGELRYIRDHCRMCHDIRFNFKETVLKNDPDIKGRMEQFKWTYEQANWYYLKLMEFDGDRMMLQQEYPCTWQEGFIASGTPLFDVQLLQRIKGFQKPGQLYELPMDVNAFEDMTKNSQLRRGKEPYVEVWEPPDERELYVIPADSSEGKKKSNPSAAYVYKLQNMHIVAAIHGLIETDPYGDYLMRVGHMYNTATLAPERNQTGVAVLNKILQENYPLVYQKHRLTPQGWEETDTIGWVTDVQSKPWIVALMRKMLNHHKDKPEILAKMFPCMALIDDLTKFTRGKLNVTRAKYGAEDDRPMAAMIGLGVCHQELGLGLRDENIGGVTKPKDKEEREKLPSQDARTKNVDFEEHQRAMKRRFAGEEFEDKVVGDFEYSED